MLMTYYTDSILHDKGIKPLPHFENRLYTFAMQYKISVQGNVEAVALLKRKISTGRSETDGTELANGDKVGEENVKSPEKKVAYWEEEIPNCGCIYG